MKFNTTNVIIGAVVIAAVIYFLKPSNEGFADSNPGAILGTVFASILGIGILLSFIGAMGEVGSGKYNSS
jgi:CBS domain containing-hemolysin-like protein